MQASTVSEGVLVDVRSVEAMKWVALVAMLIEHTAHFGLGVTDGWPFVVGRLAFPLFMVALAIGCAQKTLAELRTVVVRLVAWGLVAAAAGVFVRDPLPLNVLFTFALGVVLHSTTRHVHPTRWLVAAGVLLLAGVVEYGVLGVVAVAAAMHGARQSQLHVQAGYIGFALLLIACVRFNASAVIAIPAVLLLSAARVELPRWRGVFYMAYVAQWPVLWALSVAR